MNQQTVKQLKVLAKNKLYNIALYNSLEIHDFLCFLYS